MPELVVIGNPTARGFERAVEAVLREAARSGGDARVWPTTASDAGAGHARAALAAGADAVVAIGGDGTAREVAGELEHTGLPLGIVPIGTANLFARNLGLPLRDVRAAARVAIAGAVTRVDVGRAVLSRADGTREPEQPFLVVVGIGNDALAVEASSLRAKRRLGWPAYITAGTRRLGSPGFAVRGRFDGGPVESARAWSVLVHNAARIPAGLEVLPGTRLDDGVLHVATVSPRHLAHWGRIAAAGAGLGRAAGVLHHRRARRVTLGAVDATLPVQLDGDAMGLVERLDAHIDPGALSVRVTGSLL